MENASPSDSRIPNWLVFALPPLIGILIYLPVLNFPLFYDSLLNNRLIEHMTLASVWLPSPEHTYYRPFFFLTYIFFRDLFAQYPVMLMHGINILQHGLNVWLIMQLSWKLWGDRCWAVSSGLLFALYPFAYQDVVSFASTTHLLTLNFLLGGALLYPQLIKSDGVKRIWLTTSIALIGILGLLTHESALIFGPLLIFIHYNKEKFKWDWRLLLKPYTFFCVIDIAYLALYPLINKQSDAFLALTMTALRDKMLFALQGITYPIASLFPLTGEGSGLALILSGSVILVGFSAYRLRDSKMLWPMLLAWGWYLLGASLVVIPLGLDYVLHSPRLLYIPATGVAFLWPMLLQNRQRATHGLTVIVISGILISSALSLQGSIARFDALMTPVREMQTIPELNDGDQIIFVNLPEYLVPARSSYPLGVEFAALLGSHLYSEELVWLNTQNTTLRSAAIEVPDIRQENTSYHYGIFAPDTVGKILTTPRDIRHHVISTHYLPETLKAGYTGFFTQADDPQTTLARMGPFLLLDVKTISANRKNYLELTWYLAGEIDPLQTFFIHIVDKDGVLLTQADGLPLGAPLASLGVQPGNLITDLRPLPESVLAAHSSIQIGLYNYLTGERAPVFRLDGSEYPEQMFTFQMNEILP